MTRRSEQTREALISTGIEQLSLHGYHGTGIKQILDLVHVPKGSFYNYFGSKEAFVAELLTEYGAEIVQQLDAYTNSSDESPLQKIKTVYDYILTQFSLQNCQQGCLIGTIAAEIGSQSELCQSAMLSSLKNWKLKLSELINEAQLAGEIRNDLTAEQITSVFWSAWEGGLLQMKMEGSIDTAKETLSIMLDHLFQPIR